MIGRLIWDTGFSVKQFKFSHVTQLSAALLFSRSTSDTSLGYELEESSGFSQFDRALDKQLVIRYLLL